MTPKAFDLLLVLVRNWGHLMGKDALLREVWPNTLVEEVNLSVNVSALRRALEVGQNGTPLIETVPKRGYRFIGPVAARHEAVTRKPHGDGSTAVPSVAGADRSAELPKSRFGFALPHLGGLLVGALIFVAAISAAILWRVKSENVPNRFSSIAVLPFVADTSTTDYLAEGLAEATINALAQLRELRVAPRTSSFRHTEYPANPQKAGRELGVEAVITGKVLLQDNLLAIQVDLVDVARDAQIWGSRYEGSRSDLIQLQTKIGQDISRELGLLPTGEENRQLARHITENPDAYHAYLEGRYHWNQRSEEGLRRGADGFQRAIEIDSGFALAYSGLADTYTTLGYLSYLPPIEAFPVAKRHALRALELDASLAEAHASLGYVKLYFEWDWPGAEAEFKTALASNPNYATTHQWYSIYLLAAGRAQEAFREIQLAHEDDPLSLSINADVGFHHYYNRRYDEAVKQLNTVLAMQADFPLAHLWLGRTYQEIGRYDDALAEFSQAEKRMPDWPVSIAARGFVEATSGRTIEARDLLAALEQLAARKFVTPYGVALVYAGLGQKDAAFTWLNKAFDERSHWLVWLRLDPRWDKLRSDPRFAVLIDRMHYPQ